MRGEILKPDSEEGAGLILGEDGRRYRYSIHQVHNRVNLQPGRQVDFIPQSDEAREIYPLGAASTPPPRVADRTLRPSRPVQAPLYAGATASPAEGLWTYFVRALTKNFAQFNGRARRSEYWGFILFLILFFILAIFVDVIITLGAIGASETGDPFFLPFLTVLFFLYTILPSISITVRRLHDQDLSGWLYLVNFVPYIGGIILFILMLIDGRPAPNVHGESPKYGAQSAADAFS